MTVGADLDAQQRAGLVAVWLTPESPDVQASLSLEMLAGPKRYARFRLRSPHAPVEWSWTLHDTAVQLWRAP